MPKQPKYSDSSVYKLCCNDPTIKDIKIFTLDQQRTLDDENGTTKAGALIQMHMDMITKYTSAFVQTEDGIIGI